MTDSAGAQRPQDDSLWPGLTGVDADGAFLRGARCSRCAAVMLGPRSRCTRCWDAERIDDVAIGRRGRVYTRTVVFAAPPGFTAPYTVGYVDLPEGLRVFAHLESGPDGPAIGDEVALQIVPLCNRDGRTLTGPRYRRVG